MRGLLLALLLHAPLYAVEVKLEGCTLSWTPPGNFEVGNYEIDIREEGLKSTKQFAPTVTQIDCADVLQVGDSKLLDLYVLDQAGNRSQGLKGLAVSVLRGEIPSATDFCLKGTAADGSQVNICVTIDPVSYAPSELKFVWDAPTTNTDGTPLEDLGGYVFYSRKVRESSEVGVDVGDVTSHTYQYEPAQGEMAFSVKAYDTDQNFSAPSNAVHYGVSFEGAGDVFVAWDPRRTTGFVHGAGYTKMAQIGTTDDAALLDVYKVLGQGPAYAFPGLGSGWQANYFLATDCLPMGLAENFSTTELVVGERMYTDRQYEITSVADELAGLRMIRTANSDKSSTANPYISFTCPSGGRVTRLCLVQTPARFCISEVG